MLVDPGLFRTELLSSDSTNFAESSIADYAERTAQTVAGLKGLSGLQPGDPVKLADALIRVVGQNEPPLRFVAGADAIAAVEQRRTICWRRPAPTGRCPAPSLTTPPPRSTMPLDGENEPNPVQFVRDQVELHESSGA